MLVNQRYRTTNSAGIFIGERFEEKRVNKRSMRPIGFYCSRYKESRVAGGSFDGRLSFLPARRALSRAPRSASAPSLHPRGMNVPHCWAFLLSSSDGGNNAKAGSNCPYVVTKCSLFLNQRHDKICTRVDVSVFNNALSTAYTRAALQWKLLEFQFCALDWSREIQYYKFHASTRE